MGSDPVGEVVYQRMTSEMRFSFSVVLAVGFGLANAQPTWQRTYGGLGSEQGHCVRETLDGGAIVVGSTGSFGSGGDVYVIKLDINGDRQWSRSYGGLSVDVGWSIRQTDDEGYVLAGYTNGGQGAGYDGLLIRLDALGNEVWQKHIGTSSWDILYDVEVLADGFLAAGVTYGQGMGDGDLWLVRTNDQGDTLWTRAYASAGEDEARCVRTTMDGGIIVAGTLRTASDSADAVLLKYDGVGALQWTLNVGGDSLDAGMSVAETADGSYVLGGYSKSSIDAQVFMLAKATADGVPVWTSYIWTSFTGSTWAGKEVRELPDGRIVLGGEMNAFGGGGYDFYLLFADESGNYLAGPSFGGSGDEICWSMDLTSDDGFIIVGSTNTTTFSPGYSSVFVVRTEGDTLNSPVIPDLDPLVVHERLEDDQALLVPDPVQAGASVRLLHSSLNGMARITWMDVRGSVVATGMVRVDAPIRVPDVRQGVYSVSIEGRDALPHLFRSIVE